jgi:hypothetical protein
VSSEVVVNAEPVSPQDDAPGLPEGDLIRRDGFVERWPHHPLNIVALDGGKMPKEIVLSLWSRLVQLWIFMLEYDAVADAPTESFYLPRAGNLRGHPESVSAYKKLIELIQEHAGPGEIYASPACPEVYS